jgi:FecR protein
VERNSEQLAWSVMLGAFAALCLFVASARFGVNWYFDHAMAERPVRLDVIQGTALWLPVGGRQEVNAASQSSLSEGDQIRTADNSEVLLSFFDGSNVRLWPNTTLRIVQTKSSRYRSAETDVVLAQEDGHARYEVAIPATTARQFEVRTPQTSAVMREGSYKVEVQDRETAVTVTTGSATVYGANQAVEVLKGEWTNVPTLGVPAKPASDVHDLIITNGDFSQQLTDWQPGSRDQGDEPAGQTVWKRDENNRPFVEFQRSDASGHAEAFIHKIVNQEVTDYGLLKFNFQLRILDQALVPGAAPGSEFPLQVRVHYRDSSGGEATWTKGYYLQDDNLHMPPSAKIVERNLWTDETIDLFDPTTVSPRPADILWIEVAASGLGFQSDVASVQLLAD